MKNVVTAFVISTSLFLFNAVSAKAVVKGNESWFMPRLVENNNPELCTKLTNELGKVFLSDTSLYRYYSTKHHGGKGDPKEIKFPKRDVYIHAKESYRCGGACAYLYLVTSLDKEVIEDRNLHRASPGSVLEGYKLTLSRYRSGQYLAYMFDSDSFVDVYSVSPNATWIKSCRIRVKPTEDEFRTPGVNDAYAQVESLRQAVNDLLRGAGSCGSMATHGRWKRQFNKQIPMVLYRPWVVATPSESKDYYGSFERDMQGLEEWSRISVSERLAFERFIKEHDSSVKALTELYQNEYSINKNDAKAMALQGLQTVIDSSIRFYNFAPYDEAEKRLREAILKKSPISDIKKLLEIYLRENSINKKRPSGYYATYESEGLLPASVLYPESLKLLLNSGADPNYKNAFGKTALMYAAQYNAYKSVEILLESGADPNATTIIPENNCYYTLKTYGMTPLHYAVRYSSPEIVKLLVDNGAVPFLKAKHASRKEIPETPLDWLMKYASDSAGVEKNKNITISERGSIESLLKIPDDASIREMVSKLILDAEQQYQKGDVVGAYQKLSLSLNIDPGNERALSDMSLIALRAGRLGDAIEAAEKLQHSEADSSLKANAWFNHGLACDAHRKSSKVRLWHNGNSYCESGYLYPYYMALKESPTNSRKKKIVEYFSNESNEKICHIDMMSLSLWFPDRTGGSDKYNLFYVLRDPGDSIWPENNYQKEKYYDGKSNFVYEKIDEVSLGSKVLDVYELHEGTIKYPFKVGDYVCKKGVYHAETVWKE